MVSTRVLVVDDEPGCAELVAARLEESAACSVIGAVRDPTDALEILETERIDCVVTDYDMPDRDGLELIAAIRAIDPEVRCVLYTGFWSEDLARRAAAAGVSACLRKDGGERHYERLVQLVRDAAGAGVGGGNRSVPGATR